MQENNIIISFGNEVTEVEEYEMSVRGYRSNVIVECPNGKKYQLCFYEPFRLSQDIEDEEYIIERGLVVVKEVNKNNIYAAVNRMWNTGFFESLTPI